MTAVAHHDQAAGVLAIPDDARCDQAPSPFPTSGARALSLHLLVLQTTIVVKTGFVSAVTARNGEDRATEKRASTQQAF